MDYPKSDFIIKKYKKKGQQGETKNVAFKKCVNISNKLYNKGLNLANKGEFSNAIECLEKSILFNKANIDARNLLGLLYYKICRFTEAMKHWIISTNYDTSDENVAFIYIDSIRKNMRQFEKHNDAIRLYNQAIRYLMKKNDDLAVVRLKNALKISPNFVDAMNLLTLCYIVQSKNKKALIMAKNTLKIDNKNKKALFYLLELLYMEENILDKKYISNGKVESILDENQEEIYQPKKKYRFTTNLAMLIFGGFISALFMYFLYIPDYKEKHDKIITESKQQYENSKNNYENLKEEIFTENEQLKIENEQLQKQIEDFTKVNNLKENKDKLEQVALFIKNGKKNDAKSIFDTIDTSGFSEEDIKNYEKLKTNF